MSRCSYNRGKSILGTYESGLENLRSEIQKNFEDMDLKNSSIKEDMGHVIDKIMGDCDRLQDNIDRVRLR